MENSLNLGVGPRVVGVTGHRDVGPMDFEVISKNIAAICADPDTQEVVFGGALGADTLALEEALAYRARAGVSRPKLTVIVPDTVANQPASTRSLTVQADEVVELGLHITPLDGWSAYHARNQEIVDRAHVLVAFWNGRTKSGTAGAIKRAQAAGKRVCPVRVSGGGSR